MEQRTGLKITGVVNVASFDEEAIVIDTEEGVMNVKGSGLHVSRLTLEKGEADIDGKVDSIVYSEAKSKRKKGEGLVRHLFS
jgi:sporulation protein YabP